MLTLLFLALVVVVAVVGAETVRVTCRRQLRTPITVSALLPAVEAAPQPVTSS